MFFGRINIRTYILLKREWPETNNFGEKKFALWRKYFKFSWRKIFLSDSLAKLPSFFLPFRELLYQSLILFCRCLSKMPLNYKYRLFFSFERNRRIYIYISNNEFISIPRQFMSKKRANKNNKTEPNNEINLPLKAIRKTTTNIIIIFWKKHF